MKLVSIAAACLLSISVPSAVQEPKNPRPAQQESSLATERRELAEIQLLLGADRKYAEAKDRLVKLAESLAGREGKEAKEMLGRVEQLERRVRRALGEAVPDDIDILVDVLKGQLGEKGDKVDEAVLAALARNDYGFLIELGTRAGPGLAQAVRDDPDALPGESGRDALKLLLDLDPRRGDELLREMLEHDGFFWRKRVVRALDEATPWGGTALFSTETPPRWLGEGIRQTLEKYTEDPDVGNEALVQLGNLSAAGAGSEAFLRVVGEALHSGDPLRRQAAKKALEGHPFEPLRPLLEAVLDDGDADLRIFASLRLSKHPESRALLGHADDPEPQVRMNVLTFLRELPKESRVATLPAEQTTSGKPFVQQYEEYRAPMPAEVYRSLSKRPVSQERTQLASIACDLPAPLCFELALSLAKDSSSEVLSALEGRVDDLPCWSDPDAMLSIVSSLLDNPVRASKRTGRDVDRALRLLTATRAGLAALARWMVARNELDLRELISLKDLASIDAGLFADYVTWLFERDVLDSQALLGSLTATRALAADPSRPLLLRELALAMYLGSAWDEGLEPTVAQILSDSAWSKFDHQKFGGLDSSLHGLVASLPGEARNRAILVILDNPDCPAWLWSYSVSAFDRNSPGAVAIGKRVLERWFAREGEYNSAVRETILAMAELPELRDDRVLAEATRTNTYAEPAWNTIATLRDPAFLPLIRAALEKSGELAAARALLGYLSDEAAELLLLAAVKVPETDLRNACLAHLEKIREYQDSRERWATRKVRTATREQVVAQLVEQLSAKSDDVKVQAIRALATWEAVEVMPKLIELTTTGSKSVAAAAREALDRLNAPKKE